MAGVTWSPEAGDALREIYRYVARQSERHADLLVDRIVESVERLERFPRSGRVVPEHGRDDLRELIVRGYRVIYRVRADRLEIVTVLHGARRLGDIPGV